MSAPTEDKLHRRIVAELRRTYHRRGYEAGAEPFFHTANEGRRTSRYQAKLWALGLSAGVPDLIVVDPVCLDGAIYPGAALEFKSAKGRTSAAQLRWLGYWQAAGFYSAVLRGPREAAIELQALGLVDAVQAERIRSC